jgi:histidinol dehydrogenase
MKTLRSSDRNFRYEFEKILKRDEAVAKDVERAVDGVLEEVRLRGDKAVQKYTQEYDKHNLEPNKFAVTKAEIKKAYKALSKAQLEALELAAKRIRAFHEKQKFSDFEIAGDGVTVGQRVVPLQRVGVYVPGGKASYPSTVLMNVIPARVAGVNEVIVTTPFVEGQGAPAVLVAADLAQADAVFKIGGAQAIGAMAYGTGMIKKVDKIVGPGNAYVVCAKRKVFGLVDIDMMAGPSEVLVIADEEADAVWVAADLLSQAEHDENSTTVLITFNSNYAHRVEGEIRKQLRTLTRRKIAEASIKSNSFIIVAKDLKEAAALSDEIAPEHLQLCIAQADKLLPMIHHAGAIFLGFYSPTVCGDYLAGPSHVLPTSGSARFSSPLGVGAFLKTTSLIRFDDKAIQKFGPSIMTLAEMEGLQAHANSIHVRLKK